MKREDLPIVTPAQFRKFKPCWLETEEGRTRYERVAAQRTEWSALDVLDLEDVSEDERCGRYRLLMRQTLEAPRLSA